MKTNTQKLVITSMFAALACIATLMIKITLPPPLKGYINLGDCIVLLSGWLLSPLYGFMAAGFGSALADLFLGYTVYAPVTFAVKGLMALVACLILKGISSKCGNTASKIIGGVLAEVIMVAGYYVFEGFMYGFIPSVANMPFNAIQGAAGLIAGLLLVNIFEKAKIKFD